MRNYKLYLKDIFEAMTSVQSFIEGMDFDAFVVDDKTVSDVVMKLQIIGEAAKNVPETIREKYAHVPWQLMAGMRDRLVHGYFEVNYSIVWDTIENRIPPLQPVIAQILEDMEKEIGNK
jgi:uncharacterized protein with HEPN domain